MWWWLGQLQSRSIISDPSRRRGARRRSGEEAATPNREFDFEADLPAYATTGDGNLDFNSVPNAWELSRRERDSLAGKIMSSFWLIMILLIISPFLVLFIVAMFF